MQLGPSNTASLSPKPLLIVFQAPCMCSIDAADAILKSGLKKKKKGQIIIILKQMQLTTQYINCENSGMWAFLHVIPSA